MRAWSPGWWRLASGSFVPPRIPPKTLTLFKFPLIGGAAGFPVLPMDDPKWPYNFSVDSLARANQPGFFAFRIAQVQLGTEPITAEALSPIKLALQQGKIDAEVSDITVGPLNYNAKNTLREVYVIGNCSMVSQG